MEDDEIYRYLQQNCNIIEKMYEKTACAIVTDGLLTEWFSISVGVRQKLFTFSNPFQSFS